ncbi:MAG: LysR family transcriptional regulator [Pseudomonadota bacterium]|uniref:HTH-type transcriptional regulator MetR n=1 Tax=marine metagenome TaxID=408172 RepID=A0A381NTC2_9ZZZZ|nr:LysR family transcriptional regulator [Gammaproteobacteria bacterium]MEC9285052.1 LysR family transcriptional regulator [Pseudomonadota bacterium]HBP14137.1 LysR family transcriptional regulator [Gammaproteobacteria bacterium]HCP49343.1 LysR family transcriptional regulator [Gammaproteobacteria bacterium]|tara:strand:- start:1800 stop:2756 length:957 start_codon:yes stop_codon:yes gene_type:complete
MSNVELRHLRTLLALRDSGSLVEAAERLSLTQSALSHQLKDLENRLGCSLFVRKSRPVRFTPVGARLLKLADEIVPQFDGAMSDVTRLMGGDSGRLYMAIECHSCFEWLLPAINVYRESWPDVELDVSSGFHFEPLPALVRGDLDLVITADPIRTLEIAYIPLFGYEAVLAVATDHPLAKEPWVNPCDLTEETLITYPVDRSRLDVFSSFLEPAGVEPGAIRTAELTTMMIQLVASGRGLVCLPNWALHEHVEKNYVVAKSLGEEGVWPNLYAAVRPDQASVPFIASFVETAKKTCFATLVGIVPADEDVAASETNLE